ncbi:MAG TPA: 3'-5' exonuclease, partial [Candidatus Wallbacteria bacterium]|nr:3'-5' exonuclease [Candidatus Wallbacteria bacterium]
EMNLLDFNDIENLALESVSREEINRAVAGQYSHILIDEFQDTNDIQAGIIEKIKGRASLSIVGDGMQSIYRFRNANCSLFSKFEGMITSNGGLAVVLNDNYRSSANVLKFVNGFFEFLNFESDHPFSDFKYHPLNALSAAAENREIAVEAGIFPVINRKRSPQPPAAGCGEETPENSEAAEGGNADSENGPCEEEFDSGQFDFIARRAASLHREEGRKYGEMMILLSRMTHIDDLAGALSSAGVPFVISKSRKFFERPEILDMLNLAKSIADRDDDIAMAGLLRSPVFAVPDYILFALTESFRQNLKISGSESFSIYNALKSLRENKIDFREILNPEKISSSAYETEKARLVEIFEQINTYIQLSESLDAYGLLSFIYQDLNLSARYCRGDFGPASKNIEKLLAHIHENAFLPNGSIHDFLDNFQTAVDINFSEEESQCDSSSGDAVKIMTIHQAKGLEEKVVFVPELEADFFRAADNDIIVNSLHDIAFHPGAFVRLNERSILKNYYEAVKKYERYQEL